jgi:molybdopterin synthase catalytic subunit
MKVKVISFGVMKNWLGAAESEIELPLGATVADLLELLISRLNAPLDHSIAVSVNAEFSTRTQVLCDGDEVGLLPPVSGGTSRSADAAEENAANREGSTALTRRPIDAAKLLAEAKQGEDGAVVVFDGIVRNHSRGRQTLYLDYEAYEEMAARQLDKLARQARSQFGVRHVSIVHRLGHLEVGESSVLIVVASAHRAAAFEASRWIIDTLKKTVPIWKKETFVDGVVWADGEPFPSGVAINEAEAGKQ